ncbi:MAG: hypothetical protein IJ672_07655, partial [Methanobrevibacter sp.]|nr:hypothetical protein [Methanobrevibacter sp.]
MSKKKSSILNILTMFIYQMIAAVIGFVLPKLLLTHYGPNIHGYTSTVTTIMSYVALLNAGLSTAAIHSLYKPLAKKDYTKISEIINAIKYFYMKTGFLYLIAITVISLILPFIISSNISNIQIISIMIVMGATNTLECFVYSKHFVLLQADQKLYIVNITNSIAIFFRTIIQIILVNFNCNIVIVVGIPPLMVIFRMLLLNVYVKKNYPYLDPDAKPYKEALSKRWAAFTHQIAGLVVNNTDVMLLSTFTNMVSVSIYSVYNLVFSHLYTLMTTIFSHGTVASFGISLNENNLEKVNKAFDIYELIYYYFIVVVYSITSTMILPFVSIYTNGVSGIKYVDTNLAILFIIISILNNLRVPCNTIINAAGHFKETQNRAILEAIINLTVSLLLLKPFGMYGLLIGTICS